MIYHYQPGKENPDGRYQLFHLAEDPSEQTNLASERPEKLREMMQRLIAELESHDALYPKDKAGNELHPQIP